jgi:ketosteroid isomerase-like protein
MSATNMTANEKVVRDGYAIAERVDAEGFIAHFTPDGVFRNNGTGQEFRGRDVAIPLKVFATAFPDMHRELHRVHTTGDLVIVELSLQGTHNGPMDMGMGILPPTGKRMDTPCCDVFTVKDGKIQVFNCYPSVFVMLWQLGAIPDLKGSLKTA